METEPPPPPHESVKKRRWVLALVVVAFTARLALSCVSWGTNDARLWDRFQSLLHQHSLADVYRYQTQPLFNHPPLSALLGWAIGRISDWSRLWFPFAWRLPQLLAEAMTWALAVHRWRRQPQVARRALAVGALSLCGAWISAHHGNTDWLCASLAAWGVYLLESRSRPRGCLAAGLVLGLAINVKLIPVLLIPVLFTRCRSWREAGLFCGGLAVCTLPFLYGFAIAGGAFARNVLGYTPLPDAWGIPGLIRTLSGAHPQVQQTWLELYAAVARVPVLGAAVGFAVLGWRWRATPNMAYRLCAWVVIAFLVATPGFGVQYFVYFCPLALLVSPRWGAIYGLGVGVFVSAVYASFTVRLFPFATQHTSRMGPIPTCCGLVLWVALVWVLARGIREAWRGPRDDSRPKEEAPPEAASQPH